MATTLSPLKSRRTRIDISPLEVPAEGRRTKRDISPIELIDSSPMEVPAERQRTKRDISPIELIDSSPMEVPAEGRRTKRDISPVELIESSPMVVPAEGRRIKRDISPIELPGLGESPSAQEVDLKMNIAVFVELLSGEDIAEQRHAAERLVSVDKRGRDFIRDVGVTALLVDRLSSPDIHIREYMLTLLFLLAADDDPNSQQRQKARAEDGSQNGMALITVLRSLWKIGPGPVACNTAATILINLSDIDELKNALVASGAIDALIDVLRYRKGLPFQKAAIARLMSLLDESDENKATAAEGGIALILLRLLVHGNPSQVDMDGLLDLMALLASVKEGYDILNENDTSRSLVRLVGNGKLARQQDKVATVVEALRPPELDLNESPIANGDHYSIPNGVSDKRGKIDIPNVGDRELKPEPITSKVQSTSSSGRPVQVSSGNLTHVNRTTTSEGDTPNILNDIRRSLVGADPKGSKIPTSAVPEEFRCPISWELMKDPVTVSTGQTYDREYIQRWLDRGKRSCPNTQQRLKHLKLKPNYELKQKISKWFEDNGVAVPSNPTSKVQHKAPGEEVPDEDNIVANGDHSGDHDSSGDYPDDPEIEKPASVVDLAKIQTLLSILLSTEATEEDLREAALELHDLALDSRFLRDEIVGAGAVAPLASLLAEGHSATTQEAGIATLLNLSLSDENKRSMAQRRSPAVPAIVGLLRFGSELAREKAASTIFSLSVLDENKVTIGATKAIPTLVDVLSRKDPLSNRALKDAATGLLTLCIYQGNKATAVRNGVVPHLVGLLDDEDLLDLILALVAVLSGHVEGRKEIERVNLFPKLAQIMRSGSDRNVENALTIVSTLIVKNPALIPEAERLGVYKTVLELNKGSRPGKIKTKTGRFLEFVDNRDNY